MAVSNRERRRHSTRVRYFGKYKIHGSEGQKILTLSQDLKDIHDFPTDLGEEIEVLVIEPEGGETYVELRAPEHQEQD